MERIVQNYKAASLNVSSPFGKPKRTTPWKLARKRTKESTIFLPKRNLEINLVEKVQVKLDAFTFLVTFLRTLLLYSTSYYAQSGEAIVMCSSHTLFRSKAWPWTNTGGAQQ